MSLHELFDSGRLKRHTASAQEIASAQEVSDLIREAKKFSALIHAIIRKRHSRLIK